MFWNPDPIAFSIFGLDISWYGLTWSISIMLGYFVSLYIFRKEKKDENLLVVSVRYVFIGCLVGARVFDVLYYHFSSFLQDPLLLFRVWEGGLASHGAVFGTLLAVFLFCKKYKQFTMIWMLDRLTMPILLSGTFVRIGNFINGELYGKATDIPWAVVFCTDPMLIARHPVQLYESLMVFTLFLGFVAVYHLIKNPPKGMFLGMFFGFAFLGRVLIEFVKESNPYFLGLSKTQLVSIPIIILGFCILGFSFYKKEAIGKPT